MQFLAFMAFAFVCLAFCDALASGVIYGLYGIDRFDDPTVLQELSDPSVVMSSKIVMAFTHLGFFILPAIFFPKLLKTPRNEYLLLNRKPGWLSPVMAILVLLFFFPLANYSIWLNEQLVLPESWSALEEAMRTAEDDVAARFKVMQTGGLGTLFLNIVLIALLPAIGEELVFRGIIQKLFARWTKNIHWGIWISAAVFSAIHFQFYGFLPRMLYGALFGYLLVWTGSIWVPIIAHFFNNAMALTLNYLEVNGQIPAGTEDFGTNGEWWILLASMLPLVAVIWWLKRRSRWQEISYDYLLH